MGASAEKSPWSVKATRYPIGPGDPRRVPAAAQDPREITDIDEPARLAYRLLSGLPVRDYAGETILNGGHEATGIV